MPGKTPGERLDELYYQLFKDMSPWFLMLAARKVSRSKGLEAIAAAKETLTNMEKLLERKVQ